MKNVRTICFAALVLFLCASSGSYGTIQFRDGLTHNINYWIGDDVLADYQTPYMYTTVNWLAGGRIYEPYELYGYENSRINVRGGSIWWIRSYDSSHVNMSGGSIGERLYSYDSSQVDISGGSISGALVSCDSSQINISGGWIEWLISIDSSQVNISGGWVDWLLTIFDSSKVGISGGSINGLNSRDSSKVDISGGSIRGPLHSGGSSRVDISGGSIGDDLELLDESMIQIFGSDFAVDGLAVGYGEITNILGGDPWDEPYRRLTGTLLSGELIDTGFYIGHDARIILIPEPATITLLGIGGLVLRKRHR